MYWYYFYQFYIDLEEDIAFEELKLELLFDDNNLLEFSPVKGLFTGDVDLPRFANFDKELDNKIFKFTPPKGAEVTVLR